MSKLTALLALGHMIMPMKSAPACAASSASSGVVTPHILISVESLLVWEWLLALPTWLLVHNDLHAVMVYMEGVLEVRRRSHGAVERSYLDGLDPGLDESSKRWSAGEGRLHPLSIALQQ